MTGTKAPPKCRPKPSRSKSSRRKYRGVGGDTAELLMLKEGRGLPVCRLTLSCQTCDRQSLECECTQDLTLWPCTHFDETFA